MNTETAGQTLRVTDLIRILRGVIGGDRRLQGIWVAGEVVSVHRSGPGHIYFGLTDRISQIQCVAFNREARSLGFEIEMGMSLVVHGGITLYDPKSQYQLQVDQAHLAGAGAQAAQLEALRRRLAAEGLFAEALKRPLPRMPRRVAVVTSGRGAAVRDVIKVMARRAPGCALVVVPCTVEGPRAVEEIVRGLEIAGRLAGAEVVLLVRGGGSAEDLAAFNTEELVRAIRSCPLPVVTGVGHEVDFTLADWAADLRAATPSVAAELTVPDWGDLRRQLAESAERLDLALRREVGVKRLRLDAAGGRLRLLAPGNRVAAALQGLLQRQDHLERALRQALERRQSALGAAGLRLRLVDPARRLASLRTDLARREAALDRAITQSLAQRRGQLDSSAGKLRILGPMAAVERGYTLTVLPGSGKLVTSPTEARRAGRIDTVFATGRVTSRVEEESS